MWRAGARRASVPRWELGQHWPRPPPLRWVWCSTPNNPRRSLLPGAHAPPAFAATLILLPQICMSVTGQVRFKQALTIQTVFSSHIAALGKRASSYTCLWIKDTRHPNRQITSKVKSKLRTDVSTEAMVRGFSLAACSWPPKSASGEYIHFLKCSPHLGGGGLPVTWRFEKSGVSGFKEVRLRTRCSLPLLVKGFHLTCWNFWPAETIHAPFERTGLLTNHKISSSCYITYFLNWDQLTVALWSRDYWYSPELALQTISCHSQAHVLMLPQRTDLLRKLRKRRSRAKAPAPSPPPNDAKPAVWCSAGAWHLRLAKTWAAPLRFLMFVAKLLHRGKQLGNWCSCVSYI